MQAKIIKMRQSIVFERIFLLIFDSYFDNKEAKASESLGTESIRDRDTRMSENTMPCLEGIR
jgi:hypothetical protein